MEKPSQLILLVPHERNELEKADFMHFDAGIGLQPPTQVRTPPRGQVVAACGIPEEPEDIAHNNDYKGVVRDLPFSPLQFVLLHQVTEAPIAQLQNLSGLCLNTVRTA